MADSMSNPLKPLGHKGYGSIPHLPGSRIGAGDHHCHPGQQAICWERVRDKHDRVIVTEKLDGSNVSVAMKDGAIIALGRAGYLAETSRFTQHRWFADWVKLNESRFRAGLSEGQRFVGEWLAQAHGTRYALKHEPFVVFDLMSGQDRAPFDDMRATARLGGFETAALLSDGPAFSLGAALARIDAGGSHGALDPVEGAVWRVEHRGKFDFIAKFVRHEKKDGCLLPEISGEPAVWNWRPPIKAGDTGEVRSPDGLRVPGTVIRVEDGSFAVAWPNNETGPWFVRPALMDGTFKLHGMAADISLRFVPADATP